MKTILITTLKVITKRPVNAVNRIFYKASDNIIYILNDPCIAWVRNPLESSIEPMHNSPIDLVHNPVQSIRNKADTNCCQCRMYIMDQSCPKLQKNSITRDSDIFCTNSNYWEGKDIQPDTKNRTILSKMLFFATFTGFCCKRHFYKRVTNASLRRICCLFVPCLWIEMYWHIYISTK